MARMIIDVSRFEGEVSGLAKRMSDFSVPLRQWLVHMTGSVKMNFDGQGRPVKWAPVKVETLIRRYLRTAGAIKLRDAAVAKRGGPLGQFEPRPEVFKDGLKGAGAVSTVAGFARSDATGRILRARHGGRNKFAPAGRSFRAKALEFITQGKILQDHGTLMASITSKDSIEAGAFKGELGTNLEHGAAHQFGYPEKGLLRRPYLVIQDEDVPIFEDLAVRHMAGEAGHEQ